jgi:hypothetical protein
VLGGDEWHRCKAHVCATGQSGVAGAERGGEAAWPAESEQRWTRRIAVSRAMLFPSDPALVSRRRERRARLVAGPFSETKKPSSLLASDQTNEQRRSGSSSG